MRCSAGVLMWESAFILFPRIGAFLPVQACPTQSSTPSQSPSQFQTFSQTQTPSLTPTQAATASQSASLTQTPSQTSTPSNTGTLTATLTSTASQTRSPSQTATPSSTQSGSASGASTPSQTQSSTQIATPSGSGTGTSSPTSSVSQASTLSQTLSSSATPSGSQRPTASGTSSPSLSRTATSSQTTSPSQLVTGSASPSQALSASASSTLSATPSSTQTQRSTESPTGSPSASASSSPSAWSTPSESASASLSVTLSDSASAVPSPRFTQSSSAHASLSRSLSSSPSASMTQSVASAVAGSTVSSSSRLPASNSSLSGGESEQPFTSKGLLALSASVASLLVVLLLCCMCAVYYRCRCCPCCIGGVVRKRRYSLSPVDAVKDNDFGAQGGSSLCVVSDEAGPKGTQKKSSFPALSPVGFIAAPASFAIGHMGPRNEPPFVPAATREAGTRRLSDAVTSPSLYLAASSLQQELPSHAAYVRDEPRRLSLPDSPTPAGSDDSFAETVATGVEMFADANAGPRSQFFLPSNVDPYIPAHPSTPVAPVARVLPSPRSATTQQPMPDMPPAQSGAMWLARAAQRRGSLPLIPSPDGYDWGGRKTVSQPSIAVTPTATAERSTTGSGVGRRRASFLAAVAASSVFEQPGATGSQQLAATIPKVSSAGCVPGQVSRLRPSTDAWQSSQGAAAGHGGDFMSTQTVVEVAELGRAESIAALPSQGVWASPGVGRKPPPVANRRQSLSVPGVGLGGGSTQELPSRARYPHAQLFFLDHLQQQERQQGEGLCRPQGYVEPSAPTSITMEATTSHLYDSPPMMASRSRSVAFPPGFSGLRRKSA